jgi:predicted  nucleic acid-binding Zn-ribbon protein
MTSSEGLAKLTEYLNQTRRQAEASIDLLNEKIKELEQKNEGYQSQVEQLKSEVP